MDSSAISGAPTFYVVVPGTHTDGKKVMVLKTVNKETKEVVRQVPSDEEIALEEKLEKMRIDTLA